MHEVNRDVIAKFRAGAELPHGMDRARLVLLTTVGRRSGQPRTSPLMFHRDGDRILLVASNAGAPGHPQWYRNLLADPAATVELAEDSYRGTATPLTGAERDRWWPELTGRYPFLVDHQAAISRVIPVVAVTR